MAYIEGTEKPDELLVISAHLDHIGSENGKIYNGADDDGASDPPEQAVARIPTSTTTMPRTVRFRVANMLPSCPVFNTLDAALEWTILFHIIQYVCALLPDSLILLWLAQNKGASAAVRNAVHNHCVLRPFQLRPEAERHLAVRIHDLCIAERVAIAEDPARDRCALRGQALIVRSDGNRCFGGLCNFIVDKVNSVIFRCKASSKLLFVFIDTVGKVVCNTDVEDSPSWVGHDIEKESSLHVSPE